MLYGSTFINGELMDGFRKTSNTLQDIFHSNPSENIFSISIHVEVLFLEYKTFSDFYEIIINI